jgi:uncharacterized membrane protein YcaP (DUF421 family)
VENGKIIESGLKKSLIDVNDLLEECQSRGFFDLNEIEYAIMETSGKVSFLPKSEYDYLRPEAIAVKPPYKGLVANVIIDSKIMKKNLDMLHKTEYWLLNELKKQGYNTLDPLLLVTYDEHTHKIKTYEKINKGDTKTFLE